MGQLKIDHADTKMMKSIHTAIDQSRKMGEHHRDKRREFVRQYAGAHYAKENVGMPSDPMNLIRMMADVYTRHVVANNPAVSITSREERLYSDALDLELDTNDTIIGMNLKETLTTAAFDAMFCQGMVIVSDKLTGKEVNVNGEWTNTTKVSAEIIDPDDWFQDLAVKQWKNRMFCGHQFRRPLKAAMKDESYDKEARSELKAYKRMGFDKRGNPQIQTIGANQEDILTDEIYEEVELMYVYFPKLQRVLILPMEQGESGKGLASFKWKGPKVGPYHRLAIKDVPGNSMPLSPITMIADIHNTTNNLHRKTADQAKRSKRIGIVQGNAAADGYRQIKAPDGAVIKSNHPDASRELQVGGIDTNSLAYMGYLKEIFSWLGGNIDAIGGLAPQAETLGQDRLLSAAASKLISQMQDRVTEWTKSIVSAIAWYNMHNPVRTVEIRKRIPATEVDISYTVRPADFAKDSEKFLFDIVPFSMSDQSPSEKLQALLQFFTFFIAPNAQALAAQGIEVDFERTLNLVARYSPMPEIKYLLRHTGQRPSEQPDTESGTSRSPITQRTNIRRSVGQSGDPFQNAATRGLNVGSEDRNNSGG